MQCPASVQRHCEAAHFVTRSVDATEYDLRNGRCLCQTIHRHFHAFPVLFEIEAKKHWGDDWRLMNELKWQQVATAFDIERKFYELLVLAESLLTDFPHYTEQIKKARTVYEQK